MASKEQEFELWQKYQQGDQEAKLELLNSLTPLWQGQVNRYVASGLPRPALESEAKVLVVKSLNSYDPSKAQLNTHVTNYLKHLQRYVLNYQNVGKIPEHRGIMISRFQNIKANMTDELGREPSVAELADALNWSPVEIERLQTELRQDLTIEQGKEDSFFDYTAGGEGNRVVDSAQFIYYSVSPEYQKILEYSFGLAGNPKLSVKDIALRLSKPESYVRRARKELALKISEILELGIIT